MHCITLHWSQLRFKSFGRLHWIDIFDLVQIAGILVAPILLSLAYGATVFSSTVQNAILISIVLHFAGWGFQFVGHGVFEKRAPALLSSLSQALTLAPLFVWLEVSYSSLSSTHSFPSHPPFFFFPFLQYLFMFGYRPELQKEMNKRIEMNIAKWKNSKSKNQIDIQLGLINQSTILVSVSK